MMNSTKVNQEELIGILNKMFHFNVDPIKKTKEIEIHPELNLNTLQNLINEARKNIIKIFLDCEENYKQGIKLFSAITLNTKLRREKSRINLHRRKKEKIIMQEDMQPIGEPLEYVLPEESVRPEEHLEEKPLEEKPLEEKPLFVKEPELNLEKEKIQFPVNNEQPLFVQAR